MTKLAILSIALAAVTIAPNAPAASVFYTSEAAFAANLAPGSYLEDFNAYTYGSYVAPTLSLSGGFGFAYTISAPGPVNGGLYSGDGNMSNNSALDALQVTFTGNPVFAVGGFFVASDINGLYIPGSVVVTLSDGTSRTYSPLETTFGGFISDLPITSITVDAPDAGESMWPRIDHLYVGAVVPEPSMLAVVSLGATLLMIFRRRNT